MGLHDITSALEAIIIDPLRNFTVPDGLVFHFGSIPEVWHEDAPRIVWVPTQSPNSDAEHGGQTSPGLPNQIGTRMATVDVHCWGVVDPDDEEHVGSLAQAEQLADLVWNALQVLTPGAFTYQFDDYGSVYPLTRGWLLVRQFSIKIPVVQPTPPSVSVNAVDITSIQEH